MSILESAKAHFAGLSENSVVVPEWGDAKLTWSPMTAHEHRQIFHLPDDKGRAPDSTTMAIRTLILKAKTEDGKPAFDKMDENHLRHGVSVPVLLRVASAILGEFNSENVESEVEKAGNG